jgi:hypothetical protein
MNKLTIHYNGHPKDTKISMGDQRVDSVLSFSVTASAKDHANHEAIISLVDGSRYDHNGIIEMLIQGYLVSEDSYKLLQLAKKHEKKLRALD